MDSIEKMESTRIQFDKILRLFRGGEDCKAYELLSEHDHITQCLIIKLAEIDRKIDEGIKTLKAQSNARLFCLANRLCLSEDDFIEFLHDLAEETKRCVKDIEEEEEEINSLNKLYYE